MSDAPATKTNVRSILMVDIVSSTALYEARGNLEAKRLVGSCLQILADTVDSFRGTVVKSLGDGLLCSFTSEVQAVLAAIGMCERLENHELEIRIGVHCGEVVEDGGDIFGDAVNTASRIAALAKPSEILVSRELRDGLPSFMESYVRRGPSISVKGKREPIELYVVHREEAEGEDGACQTIDIGRTVMDLPAKRQIARLELAWANEKIQVEPDRSLSIGRGPENDVVIAKPHVSRMHAKIYHRQGKFVLEDQSANGTFLVNQPHSKLVLLREQAFLHGFGLIYLGADPDVTSSEPIRYQSL